MRRLFFGMGSTITSLVTTVVFSAGVGATGSVSSTPIGNWGTNGTVYTQVVIGHTLYLGGNFTKLVNASTGKGYAASNLAAVDTTTGAPLNWFPKTDGTVFKLAASPATSTIYAGGGFTHANGARRGHGAAFNSGTGALQSWNPHAGYAIRAILPVGPRVFIGGDFTSLQGVARQRIAAVDPVSGNLQTDWVGQADCRVQALLTDGTNLYIGGYFTKYNGATHVGLVKTSVANGAIDPSFNPHYNPNQPGCNPTKHHEGNSPFDLAMYADHLYVALGGQDNVLQAISTANGAAFWNDNADGDFQTLTLLGGYLYVGGHFDEQFDDAHGSHFGGVDHAVKVNALDGLMDASWLPRLSPSYSPYFFGCWSMVTDGTNIYAGGVFQKVNGVPHRSFAIFPGI